MLSAIPNVLDAAAAARAARAARGRRRRLGRRPRDRRPPGRAGQAQPADRRALRVARDLQASSWPRWSAIRCSSARRCPTVLYPPMFNRYGEGMSFGTHVDGGVRIHPAPAASCAPTSRPRCSCPTRRATTAASCRSRTRTACRRVKLAAGDMVLYPATSLHRVAPVTRGTRLACFFWVQSLVRDDAPARAAVRPGQRHPAAQPERRRRSRAAHADGRLSQPAAQVERHLDRAQRTCQVVVWRTNARTHKIHDAPGCTRQC